MQQQGLLASSSQAPHHYKLCAGLLLVEQGGCYFFE